MAQLLKRPPAAFQVDLFGEPAIRLHGRPLPSLNAKAMQLLALLVIASVLVGAAASSGSRAIADTFTDQIAAKQQQLATDGTALSHLKAELAAAANQEGALQKAIDDPSWGADRNNRQAESNIARLLSHWRERDWPLFHVRHVSGDPGSTYRPNQPGADFKPEVKPLPGEVVIAKHTNSAWIGTSLEHDMRARGIAIVVITGVITNNSVEATARMSGNLGFRTFVVSDATATFGRQDFDGRWRTSDEVHAMSLANLDGEYATVVTTDEVLGDAQSKGCSVLAFALQSPR